MYNEYKNCEGHFYFLRLKYHFILKLLDCLQNFVFNMIKIVQLMSVATSPIKRIIKTFNIKFKLCCIKHFYKESIQWKWLFHEVNTKKSLLREFVTLTASKGSMKTSMFIYMLK